MTRKKQGSKPEILAPAGDRESFFAAVAAGADSIYCSLKNFSARMEADNFSINELAKLSVLARKRNIKINLAINSVLKEDEIVKVGKMLAKVKKYVKPNALIVNDLALVPIAREVGIRCDLHLSTLANFNLPSSLSIAEKLGYKRVVLPRELSIDEIKLISDKKSRVELETFIHGALCYGVSGRCYWSSWFGGKSGLRGRCVQPCRRFYDQDGEKESFFSCSDLGLDVLVNVLRDVEEVKAWKIEGRKKTPHYVYYTVWGYKTLRDVDQTAKEKKETIKIFEEALSRPLSHYNFLPQRKYNPTDSDRETGSGKFVGRVKKNGGKVFLSPWQQLIKGDKIRVGYEGDRFHSTIYVPTSIPKGGKFFLRHKDFKASPPAKAPVFLIDRKEPELIEKLNELEREYNSIEITEASASVFSFPKVSSSKKDKKSGAFNSFVKRLGDSKKLSYSGGVWVDDALMNKIKRESKFPFDKKWFWLPPVIWPEEEKKYLEFVDLITKRGASNFVLNSPWHISLFKSVNRLNIWAGPFSNTSNTLAIDVLKKLGFKGAFVNPELPGEEILSLPKRSVLPLGIITKGYFPFAVSRVVSEELNQDKLFYSPKKEAGFVKKYDENYWVYPAWELDLRDKENQLKRAGYTFFAEMAETAPDEIKKLKRRKSKWNWDLKLL